MGTNFYFFTKNKAAVQQYAPYDYMLTDVPEFGYELHVGKRSYGWLPLWQAHKNGISSVKEYKAAYDTGNFKIYDEYLSEYSWEQFQKEFIDFNGGVKGVAPREKIEQDRNSRFYDPNVPEYTPISHFDYANGRYSMDYFTDEDGYEFANHEFS